MSIIKKISVTGKILNLVSASWKGIDYIRSIPRQRSADEWSQKQKNHRLCFGAVSRFAKSQMEILIRPIWNKVEHDKLSGYNQFIKANKRAFEPIGFIIDPRLLKVSEGKLKLPHTVKIESVKLESENLKLELSWKNYKGLKKERENDSLIVLLLTTKYISRPIETENLRKDCIANLEVKNVKEIPDCIYLFFRSPDKEAYSESLAIKL